MDIYRLIKNGDLDALKSINSFNIDHLNNAVYWDKLDIIMYLIRYHGVNPNTKTGCYGNTSLHYAVEYGMLRIVQFFINACRMDPNVKNTNEYNALFYASAHGRLAILKFLIRRMDPNEKNIYKRNALHFASTGGHLDIVQYLTREHQMDPNEKDINGQSAVDMASENPDILLFFKNYKFTKLVLRSLGFINIY